MVYFIFRKWKFSIDWTGLLITLKRRRLEGTLGQFGARIFRPAWKWCLTRRGRSAHLSDKKEKKEKERKKEKRGGDNVETRFLPRLKWLFVRWLNRRQSRLRRQQSRALEGRTIMSWRHSRCVPDPVRVIQAGMNVPPDLTENGTKASRLACGYRLAARRL